jgi:HSP20 family protein
MLPIMRTRTLLPNAADDFFGKDLFSTFLGEKRDVWAPSVNIAESEDKFRIDVAAPGLSRGDFKIELNDDVLTISSEKEFENDNENEIFTRREFGHNPFSRSFGLPESVDGEKIKASYKNGILSVMLPKRKEAVVKAHKEIKIS